MADNTTNNSPTQTPAKPKAEFKTKDVFITLFALTGAGAALYALWEIITGKPQQFMTALIVSFVCLSITTMLAPKKK